MFSVLQLICPSVICILYLCLFSILNINFFHVVRCFLFLCMFEFCAVLCKVGLTHLNILKFLPCFLSYFQDFVSF